MCGKKSVKFYKMALEAIHWCAENVFKEEYKSKVTSSKLSAVMKFEDKYRITCELLERIVSTNSGKITRTGGQENINFIEMLSRDDLDVLVFSFREYLYYLEYEERMFNMRDEEDLDSEERVGLAQDTQYYRNSLSHCEDLLDKYAE